MKIKKIELNIRARFSPLRERVLSHVRSTYFRDTVTQLLLIPTIFLLLAAWVLAIYYFRFSEYLVPTRYNSFLGVFGLGNWYDLYLIPLVLTVCVLSNILLGKTIYGKDQFLGYILVASNILLCVVTIAVIINFGQLLGV